MIAPRYLSRAPIKEALIDIRVTVGEGISADALDAKYSLFAAEYPQKDELTSGLVEVRFEKDSSASAKTMQNPVGYRYTSIDKKRVVQFRTDGFTFSRLEPYVTWEEMKGAATELWKVYAEVAKPSSITRVATRFINVLNIPLPIKDFRDFITAPPNVPKDLPQGIASFLTRLIIHEPMIKADCIITQALEGTAEGFAPIVLDIDVIANRAFDSTTEEHWAMLDKLRHFKNKVFFESITENTAELFQ